MMPFGGALIQLKSATELRQPVDLPQGVPAVMPSAAALCGLAITLFPICPGLARIAPIGANPGAKRLSRWVERRERQDRTP
jgi:hypothetical protein